tara:strand:+ start:13069 stop:14076 length:1008 start_codon:yes stop_codon:yes gene_type:complete
MNQFADALKDKKVMCLMIDDLDIYDDSVLDSSFLRWTKTPKKFLKLINDFKPDLVLTERVSHFSSLILKHDIPLIIFLRGNYWEEIESKKITGNHVKNFLKQSFAEKCFTKARMILPICKYLEKIVKEKYPKQSTEVMYQGIDNSEWFEKRGMQLKHPCIGLVQDANIWDKTKELLILPKILKKFPNVNFYWAGDGEYSSEILSKLEIFENFHWVGRLEYPSDVRKFFSEIDVYALISGADMSPHSILEASLMKKPILATDVGGISESVIDKQTGFLISPGNIEEWNNKISFLFSNPDICERMGESAFKFVNKNFLWKNIVDNFLKILKDNQMYN